MHGNQPQEGHIAMECMSQHAITRVSNPYPEFRNRLYPSTSIITYRLGLEGPTIVYAFHPFQLFKYSFIENASKSQGNKMNGPFACPK